MEFKTVRGMRDFLPEKARKKKFIEETCKRIFELYGFEPLETPIVEELSLLTKKGSAGAEIEQELYTFEDKAGRALGLRFDLTVPLARVVASNKQLAMPFKRYQIGRVYRYDRPQAKRYREFTQADVDIIGVSSVLAELELIALSYDVIKALGIEAYLTINSRELLESLALASSVKEEQLAECFRAMDKAEKLGWAAVEKELEEKGINTELLDIVKKNDLNAAEEKIKERKLSTKGLEEIKELMGYLKAQQLSRFVKVDLALARGLDYYTGIVMEIKIASGPSIGGGGRYDKLIGLYSGRELAATGISFGVDRILDTIEDKLPGETKTKVFVTAVSKELTMQALELTQNIRKLGINAEFDLMQRNISKNLEYANKKGIPYAIILGPRELQAKQFKLKNMESGKECLIGLDELEKLREIL
ncbi:MAG: histidine--tRNA ligase [Candidatus Iainarchaeum archaeon]|uniref:Histidine--tRNA ligase n=1 Tax=Candidatus Iainarchaeum sp. TaxID=3101447 RepID=A0A497JHD7_9ARCH|nr:MAG: histidine--tRNA ligase [Candidatus Diapherotrites archaeon]